MRPRRIVGLSYAIASLMLVVAVVTVAAQASTKPVSTSTGVYTTSQAARGEQTYMNICVACHPAGTYSTPAFREKWNGMLVSELFSLVSTTMPKMEPASLEPQEYAQVVAYVLKINGAPAGKTELPATVEELKHIRIDMPAGDRK